MRPSKPVKRRLLDMLELYEDREANRRRLGPPWIPRKNVAV